MARWSAPLLFALAALCGPLYLGCTTGTDSFDEGPSCAGPISDLPACGTDSEPTLDDSDRSEDGNAGAPSAGDPVDPGGDDAPIDAPEPAPDMDAGLSPDAPADAEAADAGLDADGGADAG